MTLSLPNGFTSRPATLEDTACVAELWNDRFEATRGTRPSTADRVAGTWKHPKFSLLTDSRLIFSADDSLVGYAHVRDVKDPPVDVFGGYCVHPDYDDTGWLWDDLFAWMDAEARRVMPKAPEGVRVALVAGATNEDTKAQDELSRHGFEYTRTFHRMAIEFREPAASEELPTGIAIRAFAPGDDDIGLVTAHREAFADHFGMVPQPFEADLEDQHRLMQEDNFDASLWFLACEGETVVGFCLCYPEAPGEPEHGLIDELGVRPAWRRRGLGRSLLLHAFAELTARGIRGAALNVDTENPSGAPELYERAGMHSVRASHTYVKELRPGVNLVPQ